MKKNLLFVLSLLTTSTITGFEIKTCKHVEASEGLTQSSLSSTMDINLKSVSESNIRSYYSNLNSLSNDEKKGTNLLKNLKPILRNNFEYYSYENVWKIYEITDRDWTLSPASQISCGTYNETSQTISNYKFKTEDPYVHAYYRDHTSTDASIIADSKITAWSDHNATGINREHIWPQSHGFKADSGASGPAGTDIHHLVAADGYVNQSVHNNDPYGYVKSGTETKIGNRPSTTNNKVGKPKTSDGAIGDSVFEPQDQDKGDIARACFYMVAMYNNYANESGVITQFDANLNLVAYATEGGASEISSDTKAINLGNLKDLLEWNKLDPVDEYEIYRNDLIYNNFQHNRNPFIDFPEWADIVWGDLGETRVADPANDDVYKGGTYVPSGDNEDDGNKDSGTSTIFDFSKLDSKTLIVIAAVAVVVIIIAIVIFAKSSKKTRKKITKGVKKIAKKASSSSSSKKKK